MPIRRYISIQKKQAFSFPYRNTENGNPYWYCVSISTINVNTSNPKCVNVKESVFIALKIIERINWESFKLSRDVAYALTFYKQLKVYFKMTKFGSKPRVFCKQQRLHLRKRIFLFTSRILMCSAIRPMHPRVHAVVKPSLIAMAVNIKKVRANRPRYIVECEKHPRPVSQMIKPLIKNWSQISSSRHASDKAIFVEKFFLF